MRQEYADIKNNIAMEPWWYDEEGVPRYTLFSPKMLCNIYAVECAFLEVECQSCGRKFFVAVSEDARHEWLSDCIKAGFIHYGDPPFHRVDGLPCGGTTMNAITTEILKFWARESEPFQPSRWVRKEDLEGKR